ncbi:MAG: hypothetical protein SFV54_05545 [Bryobacteraceae bacterium]|nr:hypothetical protein [Bryobacteraceae bacterium]
MAQISDARLAKMERIATRNPAARFRIIVSLRDAGSQDTPLDSEFDVEHDSGSIVSGSASLAAIRRLRSHADVELVEEDGEMHAL